MKQDQRSQLSSRNRKISRVSIVDQICSSIKQDIADGIWKPGDKLPSEAEFADIFAVNRLSVRMALQKLNTLGIIETRVGEGSFVCAFSFRPVFSELSVFYDGKDKYKDVQQLRNLLELECTRLAISSATPEEIQELHTALEDYNARIAALYADYNEERLEQAVDADFKFHCTVVKMSHNKLYKDIYAMVQQLIRSHITELVSTRCRRRMDAGLSPSGVSDSHARIYDAIVNSDPEGLSQVNEALLGIVPLKDADYFDNE